MEDHRIDRTKAHSVENIVFITLAAVLCGADTWTEIERFGHRKREWFEQHLDLSNGIPSHDTLNRFFSGLDPQVFEKHFRKWASEIAPAAEGSVVHLDGKTIRGSRSLGKSAIHMVSAWSNDAGVSLGQIRTEEKSNEITAIPELIEAILVRGMVVTIDAMGCQENIVKHIVAAGGDYVIAVKQNQPQLFEDIDDSFRAMGGRPFEFDGSATVQDDFGHGRIETRTVTALSDLSLIDKTDRWTGIQSIIRVAAERIHKATGEVETATRYYISSLPADASRHAHIIRSHWSIENNLHWCLDVCMGEDADTKRNENSVINFSLIRKIALTILRNPKTGKQSIQVKRKEAGWDNSYLSLLMRMP